MFKKVVFAVSLLTLFFGAGPSAGVENLRNGGPSVSVAEDRYHFEKVVDGEIVTHGFVVRNIGSAPLVIKDFKAG